MHSLKFAVVLFAIFVFVSIGNAQSPAVSEPGADNVCYVYLVDVAKAKKLYNRWKSTLKSFEDMVKAEVTFPEIKTDYEEEELTTKHFRFPNSNLWITASIYYTDESPMGETISAGIAVSPKKLKSAFDQHMNNSIAEVTLSDYTDRFSTQKYLTVNKKLYLLGFECDCGGRNRFPSKK